jgi:DNA-binding Lrp family transcriptional regulator
MKTPVHFSDLSDVEDSTLNAIRVLFESGDRKWTLRNVARLTSKTVNAVHETVQRLKRKGYIEQPTRYGPMRLTEKSIGAGVEVVNRGNKSKRRTPEQMKKRRLYAAMYAATHQDVRRETQKRHRATRPRDNVSKKTFVTLEELDAIASDN